MDGSRSKASTDRVEIKEEEAKVKRSKNEGERTFKHLASIVRLRLPLLRHRDMVPHGLEVVPRGEVMY